MCPDSKSASERPTASQLEQWKVENEVFKVYDTIAQIPRKAQAIMLELQRDKHLEYLTQGLKYLGPSFAVLDSNRPWLCYWILHSIALLGGSIDDELESQVVDFLNRCQDPTGGFGGGPGQLPHLATTYAAVNSLITVGGHGVLLSINRDGVYNFLLQMKVPSGGFRMHDMGEIDVRACYTAISVASVLNILTNKLVENVGNYILSCQTYEGGIAGEPGSEAHGGYTYCGLATMILINEVERLDLPRLVDWVVFRQGVECGFQGRTNKLVDGCYSFWQGGVLVLLRRLDFFNAEKWAHSESKVHVPASSAEDDGDPMIRRKPQEPLFNSLALQQYLLLCSQDKNGGFRDKPGKARDYYHTCYCLSGLSLCQHGYSDDENCPPFPSAVLGPYLNLLECVDLMHNVVVKQLHDALEFFSDQRF